jgi:hypothetical protein
MEMIMMKQIIKICPICKKEFKVINPRYKYCNPKCLKENNRRVKRDKVIKKQKSKPDMFCLQCQKLLDKFSTKTKYCSTKCHIKYHNNSRPKILKQNIKCKHCGKIFLQKHKNHVFCCKKHLYTFHNKNKPKKEKTFHKYICVICGKEYISRYKNSKTCSKKCCDKNYTIHNREKINIIKQKWKKNNPDKIKQYNKTYFERNPEMRKKHIRDHNRKWKEHPIKNVIQSLRKHNAGRCRTLKSKKLFRHDTLIGCDGETFKKYIESKFEPNMKWENYGRGGWVLDHIKRLADFDLSIPSEQLKAFSYKNLQPMWEDKHLEKTAKENRVWKKGKV